MVEVLVECHAKEQLNTSEIFFIKLLNTKSRDGYNCTKGGESGSPSDEKTRATLRMIQAKNRKPVICIETGEIFESINAVEKICGIPAGDVSKTCHEQRTIAGGKHFVFLEDWLAADEETRAKWLAKPMHVRKRVRCVETNEIFSSIREAARNYGIDHKNISRACEKPTRTAGGYHFEFVDEE